MGVAVFITFLNWFTKFFLRKFGPYEKHSSIAEEKRRTTLLLACVMVVNTGGVILLINLSTFGTPDWYQKVGTVIATTMLTTIPINNILNPLFIVPKCISQCLDRRCSCNCEMPGCKEEHLTKTQTQTDFEAVNIGNEFFIENRQSSIMFFVFITMMYSGGLPVLYPIASVYFFVTYWMDKYLLINFYKEPPHFNELMVKEIIYTFKWAFACHFIVSIFMYKDPKIMEAYPKVKTGHQYKFYIFIVGVFLSIQLLWRYLIKPCRECFSKCRDI